MTIYNLSKEDVRQLFNGIPIIVPAGGSMELEPDAASHLLAKQPRLSAEKPEEFACSIKGCGKVFKSEKALRMHMLNHKK